MLPELRFSSQPVVADMLVGDDMPRKRLVDFEMGGADIQDPTQGLQVKVWRFYKVGDQVRVAPADGGPHTVVLSEPGITDLAGSFDQNMRPVLCYVVNGVTKLYWYDPEIPAMVKTVYPGIKDALLVLDDKRDGMRDFSDVLMFYRKSGEDPPVIYMRAQRDRYLIEYAIGETPALTTNLVAAGMSKNNRIRFKIVGRWPQVFTPVAAIPYYPPGVTPPGFLSGLNLIFDNELYEAPPPGGGLLTLKYDQFYYPPVSDPAP